MTTNIPAEILPNGSNLRPKFDIIWNVTAVCGHDCAMCCVSATHTKQKGGLVYVSTPELDGYSAIKADHAIGNLYDQALKYRQDQGLELTYEQKLRVLDHLSGHQVQLDLSGGDVLSPRREGSRLLAAASCRLGKDAITLTATGSGLVNADVHEIAGMIKELNFTFDGTPDQDDPLRPMNYAVGNLRKAREFADAGVLTRAECPLSTQNLEPEQLTRIYTQLHDAGIDKLLLMRLFPSGRGDLVREAIPTNAQYKRAIAVLRALESKFGGPAVKLQCALRWLEGPSDVNPCDAITESFGLDWTGTLLGSPWAIGKNGKPIDDAWVMGNLVENSLTHILASDKVRRMQLRGKENFGSCKFIAWVHGTSRNSEDRIFENSDPLYKNDGSVGGAA